LRLIFYKAVSSRENRKKKWLAHTHTYIWLKLRICICTWLIIKCVDMQW